MLHLLLDPLNVYTRLMGHLGRDHLTSSLTIPPYRRLWSDRLTDIWRHSAMCTSSSPTWRHWRAWRVIISCRLVIYCFVSYLCATTQTVTVCGVLQWFAGIPLWWTSFLITWFPLLNIKEIYFLNLHYAQAPPYIYLGLNRNRFEALM